MDEIAPETGDSPLVQQPAPGKKNAKKRNIIVLAVVSILNVGLLTLLITQLLTPAQTSVDPMIGKVAPNFTLSALYISSARQPSTLSLSNYEGQPVVLNLWSSTCGPCIAEAPLLQAQWVQAKAKGVVFLGIDYQDVQADGQHFLQQYGITYPNALDATGTVAINYGVTATPETFFINKQGVILAHTIGQITQQTLQSNLRLIVS